MWGASGMVHAECVVIGLYGCMLPVQEIPTIAEAAMTNLVEINEPVVSTLPMYNTGNYYHWICEGLARCSCCCTDLFARGMLLGCMMLLRVEAWPYIHTCV
jgi:hypothetical protein